MPRKYSPHPLPSREERFWARVRKSDDPNGCWLWTGSLAGRTPYGNVGFAGRYQKAHRVAYQLAIGPIPEGLHICHTCDIPACCNPAHLFAGTRSDNMRDREAKGRHNAPRGTVHGRHKLTESQVRDIRAQHDAGTALNVMADHYGVTKQSVWAIVHRKTWVHLD